MPRIRKIQRTEQAVDKFSEVPSDNFSLIFQFYMNDARAVSAMAQTCKLAQVNSKKALELSYQKITIVDYRLLKVLYIATQKWLPEKRVRNPADVILMMRNLVKVNLSGLFAQEVLAEERRKMFKGFFMRKIARAPKVEELVMDLDNLGEVPCNEFMAYMLELPKSLRKLDVSITTGTAGKLLKHLAKKAPNLTSIKLPKIDDADSWHAVAAFDVFTKTCTQLTNLDCGDFDISYRHMPSLKNCPKLISLRTSLLSDRWSQFIPQLISLDLKSCQTQISQTWMRNFLLDFPGLQELRIGSALIGSDALQEIAELGKNLRILDFSGNRIIMVADIEDIIVGCEKLEELVLEGCSPKFMNQPFISAFPERGAQKKAAREKSQAALKA